MAGPGIRVPDLGEKFDLFHLHFLVRERYRPQSQHLYHRLEALWEAAGRDYDLSLETRVSEWRRYLRNGEKVPADLADGLCKMYVGLSPQILMAPMDEYWTFVVAHQTGPLEFKAALNYYDVHRAELTALIRPYYLDYTANPELPLITRPRWIPERPIPIGLPGQELAFGYEFFAEQLTFPNVSGLNATLHEVRRSMNTSAKMRNDDTYRPLEIEVNDRGLRLTCGPGRYFEYHDSCEILGLELSRWALANPGRRPNSDGSDLPLRGPAENIFDLRNRSAVVGVSTLLLALDYEGSDWYFRHERGHEVAVNPDAWSVVPSGTFQPIKPNLESHNEDFIIRSTILRELAEELLGRDELQWADDERALDFKKTPLLRDFVGLLDSGLARIYFLGIGFDPVSTVPEVLTTLIFRADDLPPGTMSKFKNNFEGRYKKTKLSAAELRQFAHRQNVHSASVACARLTALHFDQLISEVRRPRRRTST